MEFTVTKEEGNYILDITVPKGVVDNEVLAMAKTIQPRVKVKGFRQGHVPIDIIKGRFLKEIRAEVSTRILYNSVAEILRKEKIRNAGNPALLEKYRPTEKRPHAGWFGLDGSLSFQVEVEAPPEVDLNRYTGIEVEVNSSNFDEWVEKELFKQQVAFGDKEEVQRACKVGDEVVASFVGKLDGEAFEGGSHEDYIFVIGGKDFVPGFEEGFVDKQPGESFTTTLTFPETYPQPTLAGKEVEFDCELKEVYEIAPHELDEELAMMLSYESVENMMESYQEMWQTEFEKPLRSELFNNIMDVLIEENSFPIPDNWIEQEIKLTMARMGLEAQQLAGNQTLFDSLKDISERSVRISFLLDKVYELETGIHLTAEEIEELAEKEGSTHGLTGIAYLDSLRKQGQYETFIAFKEQQKSIDFLISNAKVKEKVDEQ